VAYLALVLGGIPLIQATKGTVVCIAYVLALTVALVTVCWFTGEPPRWHWGGRDA